jgi:hypothetical protein
MDSADKAELTVRLDFIQRGRALRRYHTMEMLEYQRIDSHSFGVAMFTTVIVPVASPVRRSALLMAALTHDLPEHKTGDVPAPFKREFPQLRKMLHGAEDALLETFGLCHPLDAADQRVLGLADCADGAAHCIMERAKGNIIAREPFKNFWRYLQEELNMDMGPTTYRKGEFHEEGERALSQWLAGNWYEANGGVW